MSILTILGIVLIVAGALIVFYHGFTYKKNEKIAQVGDVNVKLPKPIYFSPTAGWVLIGVGILLLILRGIF